MIRASGTAGFRGPTVTVSSSRLTNAVVASLAVAALSLCLIVTLTVLSTKATMAMGLPSDPRFIPDPPSRCRAARADRHRDRTPMKSPVVVVAITLTAAILVAASLLIFTGVRKSSGRSTLNAPAQQQRLRHAHLA